MFLAYLWNFSTWVHYKASISLISLLWKYRVGSKNYLTRFLPWLLPKTWLFVTYFYNVYHPTKIVWSQSIWLCYNRVLEISEFILKSFNFYFIWETQRQIVYDFSLVYVIHKGTHVYNIVDTPTYFQLQPANHLLDNKLYMCFEKQWRKKKAY